jgi:hypothetical protein
MSNPKRPHIPAAVPVHYGDTINPGNGTNSITITSPAGNLFFRLSNP